MIHLNTMSVQWNRSRPPRIMGTTELFLVYVVSVPLILFASVFRPMEVLEGAMDLIFIVLRKFAPQFESTMAQIAMVSPEGDEPWHR